MKAILITILCIACVCGTAAQTLAADANTTRPIVESSRREAVTVEEAIAQQKRTEKFSLIEIENSQLQQLGWAAQSAIDTITSRPPGTTAAPINLYFCSSTGVSRYNQSASSFDLFISTDVRSAIAATIKDQPALKEAPCLVIIAGSISPTATISRAQARDMLMLTVGRISQNMELEAQASGLGASGIPLFDIGKVRRAARLPQQEDPVYIMAVGYPAGTTPERIRKFQPPKVLLIFPGSSRPNELFDIKDVLIEAGAKVFIAQSGISMIRADKYQRALVPDMGIQDVAVGDYDAIIIIGGTGDPAFMRDPTLINIVRAALNQGKIVGAAGDTVQVLVNAGALRGVKVTGAQRLLINSGAIYTGNLVESDQGIVTALASSQSSMLARAIYTALKNQDAAPTPASSPQPMARPRY